MPPPTVATPAPPTPTPSPYPSTDGETFAYHGTYTQQYSLYGTPAPSASPGVTPEPTSTPWTATSSSDVSAQVTVRANVSFNGVTGLTELETNESDTGAVSTYSVDSKQYLQFAPNASRSNGIDVRQVALDASDSNGVQTTTTFGDGNGLLDELPQVPASQWSNAPTRVTVEKDPSSEAITSTYAADGTYNGSTLFPQGDTASITENADGSGMYMLPFLGVPGSEVTISPVTNDSIGITFKQLSTNSVGWGDVPVWYPNVPPVLAADTFSDSGTAAIPSSCKVPASVGIQGTRIDEQRVRLDTVMGELERTTQSSYVVPPYGAVCVVMHDDLLVYYDYSGQSTYLFSGTPLRETVSDETLGLTGVPNVSAKVSKMSASLAAGNFIAPSTVRVRLAAAKHHLQFVRRMTAVMKESR